MVRGEYIDGELVMSPFPTRRHQTIARRTANLIEAALPPGVGVVEGWGWKPGADEFAPDVMVFNDTAEDKRLAGIPHLVVEILSSDPARDIIRKAAKYAAAGVERCWIIDPDGPNIIVYQLSSGSSSSEHATDPERSSPLTQVRQTSPSIPPSYSSSA